MNGESRAGKAPRDGLQITVVLRLRKARVSYSLSLHRARGRGILGPCSPARSKAGAALRPRRHFGAAFDSYRRVHSARMRSRFFAMNSKSMSAIAAGAAAG
jgi:hypothetical protein